MEAFGLASLLEVRIAGGLKIGCLAKSACGTV
jgi:hypothetical protein